MPIYLSIKTTADVTIPVHPFMGKFEMEHAFSILQNIYNNIPTLIWRVFYLFSSCSFTYNVLESWHGKLKTLF
jgi:hypothetical protein